MATITANLPLNAGDTGIVLFLYSLSDGSLLNLGGDSLAEVANGLFQADVDDAHIPSGEDLRADAQNGTGVVIASDILYDGSSIIGVQPQLTLIDDLSSSIGSSGNRAVTITVTDAVNNIALANAPVQLQDASGNAVGVVRHTGSSGSLILNLDDGSYKLLVGTMYGYEVHVAEDLTVSPTDTAKTLSMTPSLAIQPASDPALCNVLVKVLNQYGQPLDGATVTARIESPDFLLNTVVSNEMTLTQTTDVNGHATLSLIRAVEFIRGGKYEIMIKVDNSTQKFDYYVPNQDSVLATFTS